MDQVHVSIATLPNREESLRRAIASLRGQVDRFHVYLNGHEHVPEFLNDHCFEVERSDSNNGAVMKFWWANRLDGYLLFCDDDIVYPRDYVKRVVESIDRYGRRAVVGFHGIRLRNPFERYTRDRGVIHFNDGLTKDNPVHILGTGVMGYHSSTPSALAAYRGDHFRVSMADFPYRNMLDIWFGIACQEHEVPLVCLARPYAWFESIPQLFSLWDDVERDDTKQSQSVLDAWPWTLRAAKEKTCQSS